MSADCHTVKNRKISEKSRKFWPFLAYVVPKGPGCPDFHPKTPQKIFRRPSGGGLAAFGGVVVSLCTKDVGKAEPFVQPFHFDFFSAVCLFAFPVPCLSVVRTPCFYGFLLLLRHGASCSGVARVLLAVAALPERTPVRPSRLHLRVPTSFCPLSLGGTERPPLPAEHLRRCRVPHPNVVAGALGCGVVAQSAPVGGHTPLWSASHRLRPRAPHGLGGPSIGMAMPTRCRTRFRL